MRLDRSELSKAVQTALSLGAVAAVGVAGTAFAQNAAPSQNDQKQPQTLQTIVVTGSHIRRVDLETSNPVVAVTAQQIAQTGKLTLGDVVQQLPVITGGVENPRVNNGGGSGQTLVGLRGLGASRTLVLVDGQRVISSDLNSIPAAAVERIEVLTDGASSVYGSDAIGGVINIILKTNYQGAQFQLNYGISDHDDGERKGASFVFGQTSDKGSIMMGVDYSKFDSILQSARKFSKDALSLTATNTDGSSVAVPGSGTIALVGGSSYAARTRVGVPDAVNPTGAGCTLSLNPSAWTNTDARVSPNDYHCFGSQPGDKYNYASVNFLLTPQERTNFFAISPYRQHRRVRDGVPQQDLGRRPAGARGDGYPDRPVDCRRQLLQPVWRRIHADQREPVHGARLSGRQPLHQDSRHDRPGDVRFSWQPRHRRAKLDVGRRL
jgi:outer membrane receptor protein involved in Fe transport